jgi:hypothetical protein
MIEWAREYAAAIDDHAAEIAELLTAGDRVGADQLLKRLEAPLTARLHRRLAELAVAGTA